MIIIVVRIVHITVVSINVNVISVMSGQAAEISSASRRIRV